MRTKPYDFEHIVFLNICFHISLFVFSFSLSSWLIQYCESTPYLIATLISGFFLAVFASFKYGGLKTLVFWSPLLYPTIKIYDIMAPKSVQEYIKYIYGMIIVFTCYCFRSFYPEYYKRSYVRFD